MQRRAPMFRLLSVVVLLAPALIASGTPRERRLTLWAWERPEDLRFLPRGVDVTYLAATVTLGADVSVHPRAQPLRVPDHVVPRPLVRIEERGAASLTSLSDSARERLISALLAATGRSPSLQIDFDAKASETDAYLA